MGRLFWKFFVIIWFAQITTVAGVSSIFWFKHRQQEARFSNLVDVSPPADFLVDSAASTLRFGGPGALKELLKREMHSGIFAVDPGGRDMLGRTVDPRAISMLREMVETYPDLRGLRKVEAGGSAYLLFAAIPKDCRPPCRRFVRRRYLPVAPIIGGFFASLIFAALLARYFSTPLGNLRAAFESASGGDLGVRLGPLMGERRDEIADLGRHFDSMAAHLGALMDGQRRLLHDVSHELRSPLARLQAAIGLARQQPEKMEASLDRIERESERMDRLVGELLALSRIEAGVASGALINMDELVASVVEDASFEAGAAGKSVSSFGVRGLLVRGDAELLHRSIENVVRNAIRHTPDGGKVSMEVRQDGGWVRILVSDQGRGISENELEAIFMPFFRGLGSRGKDGHGLGLSIARRVALSHGGSIRAFNLPDAGLCVEILLPSAQVR